MKTKPTNFEAAKAVILIGEEVTAEQIIGRMLNNGRKEVPTKKSLSVKFRYDKGFIIIKNGRDPTIFKRVN
jgi:hypothetical protein